MGERRILDLALSRRRFLGTAAVTVGAAAATMAAQCDSALLRRVAQSKTATPPRHSAWVWQFSVDGPPEGIAASLARQHMAAVVKTHDGLDWMSKYDHHAAAVSGPGQIAAIASMFERSGVPFHAWAVIKGIDPVGEAQMAADVLAAGARSLVLDLEGYAGFWTGSPAAAVRFGQELRARTPNGRVDISIDARPWRLKDVPLPEFMPFIDGIWPQLYWETFDSQDNFNAFRFSGYPPDSDGITPIFLLDVAHRVLAPFDRWIVPIGQGASNDATAWPDFAHRAWELQMPGVSVWRYGVTSQSTLQYLGANPPGREPQAQPHPTKTPTRTPAGTSTPVHTPTKTKTPTITPTNTQRPTRTPTRTPTP